MPDPAINVASLPPNTQASFEELAGLLQQLAGDKLLSISAFGGWLHEDPLFKRSPARSVVVLDEVDLKRLAQLATEGQRFGQRGLAAPLIMTPVYIDASRDVFPLELLEIQQVHITITGPDHFADLRFDGADLRLQCERELKSELIRLRQGLLSAAGDEAQLTPLGRDGAERAIRVLRGMLHLAGRDTPPLSTDIVAGAAEISGARLTALASVIEGATRIDFALYERLYAEIDALSSYADRLVA